MKHLLLFGLILLLPLAHALAWQPDCDYSSTGTGPWEIAFADGDTQVCQVDSLLYIKTGVTHLNNGYWKKTSTADVFIDFIGFEQDKQLKFQNGVEFVYDTYRPYYLQTNTTTDTPLCIGQSPYNLELFFVANENGETFRSNLFNTIEHLIPNPTLTCGEWQEQRVNINAMSNDYGAPGSSFSASNRFIETLAFEQSNVYIRNVRIIDYLGSEFTVWDG